MPGDERDRRRRHTPITGVQEQLAGPIDKRDHTPVGFPTIPETGEESLERRIKETKNTSITTLDRVDTLRRETREDFKVVHSKIDDISKSVKLVEIAVARTEPQNTQIISMLDEAKKHRENTEHVKTTMRVAEVEVDKTRQIGDVEVAKTRAITEINDEAAAKLAKREITKAVVLKVLAAVGLLWGFISVTYLSNCGAEAKKPVPAEKAPNVP